jgi:hypothetical protein
MSIGVGCVRMHIENKGENTTVSALRASERTVTKTFPRKKNQPARSARDAIIKQVLIPALTINPMLNIQTTI